MFPFMPPLPPHCWEWVWLAMERCRLLSVARDAVRWGLSRACHRPPYPHSFYGAHVLRRAFTRATASSLDCLPLVVRLLKCTQRLRRRLAYRSGSLSFTASLLRVATFSFALLFLVGLDAPREVAEVVARRLVPLRVGMVLGEHRYGELLAISDLLFRCGDCCSPACVYTSNGGTITPSAPNGHSTHCRAAPQGAAHPFLGDLPG